MLIMRLLPILFSFLALGTTSLMLSGCMSLANPRRVARDMMGPRRINDAAERIHKAEVRLVEEGFQVVPRDFRVGGTFPGDPATSVTLKGWIVRPTPEITVASSIAGFQSGKGAADAEAVAAPQVPGNRRCVFVVHGLGDTRAGLRDWIELFARANWDVVTFDLRAHGISDGDHCTYGLLESKDFLSVLEEIRAEGTYDRMVLFGYSLGGAITLLAESRTNAPEIRGVISCGAYADFPKQADFHLRRRTRGLSTEGWRDEVVAGGGEVLGVPLSTLSPAEALRNADSTVPVLLIHGTEDATVPVESAQELAAAAGSRAEVYIVPDAGHVDLLDVGGEPLRKAVLHHLERFAARD